MKTIVYVTEAMGGGVLSYLKELSNALCNKAKIYVLYGRRKQTPKNLRDYFNPKVTLIEIKNFQRSLNPVKDFKAYLEVKRWIKRINPDIVHLNSSKAGALGRVMFHHKGQKWFYTPHGYAFLMKDSSKLKRLFYYLVELILAKLGTTTIACGYGEYKIAHKLSNNSTYVNNGVDINKLKQYWSNDSNTQNTFFTIGRINFQKNPTLFNKIAEQFPNNRFVWCGDGELRNKLTSPNITVTGWLPQKELFKIIQPYKYFIMSSRWEGLPMALLEAMYFKKCCFVTNVVGNRDLIKSGYDGYIFNNTNDIKEYTHHFRSITKHAQSSIVNKYNINHMINNYEEIYKLF